MTEEQQDLRLRIHEPATYVVRVQGVLDESWSDYCGGLSVVTEATPRGYPVTTLSGRLADQAALMGVLNHLYMLGLPLLFVEWIHSDRPISGRATADVEGNSF